MTYYNTEALIALLEGVIKTLSTEDDLISPRQASDILRVSERQVLRIREAGDLTGIPKTRGKKTLWKFRKADVEALAQKRGLSQPG